MLLATHAIVGAVIGKTVENPWIIAISSLVFHYALDMTRHGEYLEFFDSSHAFKKSSWKVALDFSLAAALVASFIYLKKPDFIEERNVFIGVISSLFPDLLNFLYWLFRWKSFEKLYKFHSWIHRLPRSAPERQWDLRNEIYEITIAVIAIIVLISI